MSERRIDAFFYGLFMDAAILRASGVADAANPRQGFPEEYVAFVSRRGG